MTRPRAPFGGDYKSTPTLSAKPLVGRPPSGLVRLLRRLRSNGVVGGPSERHLQHVAPLAVWRAFDFRRRCSGSTTATFRRAPRRRRVWPRSPTAALSPTTGLAAGAPTPGPGIGPVIRAPTTTPKARDGPPEFNRNLITWSNKTRASTPGISPRRASIQRPAFLRSPLVSGSEMRFARPAPCFGADSPIWTCRVEFPRPVRKLRTEIKPTKKIQVSRPERVRGPTAGCGRLAHLESW